MCVDQPNRSLSITAPKISALPCAAGAHVGTASSLLFTSVWNMALAVSITCSALSPVGHATVRKACEDANCSVCWLGIVCAECVQLQVLAHLVEQGKGKWRAVRARVGMFTASNGERKEKLSDATSDTSCSQFSYRFFISRILVHFPTPQAKTCTERVSKVHAPNPKMHPSV